MSKFKLNTDLLPDKKLLWTNPNQTNDLEIREINATVGKYLPVPIYIDSSYYVALQYNSGANAIQTYNKGYANSDIEIVVEYTKKTD